MTTREDNHKKVLRTLQGNTMEFLEQKLSKLPNPEDGEFQRLTLDLGIRIQNTWLEWLEYAKRKIKHMEDGSHKNSSN